MKNLLTKIPNWMFSNRNSESTIESSAYSIEAGTIARLQKEKKICLDRYYTLGRKKGSEWAQAAPYESLLTAYDWAQKPCDFNLSITDTAPAEFKFEFRKKGLFHDVRNISDERRDSWLEGWLDAVSEFFDSIEEAIG